MSKYYFSVIVPIIYLTEFSSKSVANIFYKARKLPNIYFILSCSQSVELEVNSLYERGGNLANVRVIFSNNGNSNYLRYNGLRFVETDYVYYQDCDDEVNYEMILDNIHYCNGGNVVCFNIRRRQFDISGQVKDDRLLYPPKSFSVKHIDDLMTNIVNKLIPISILYNVSFYNIPFSQDLSLSFQLFEKCPHFYCSDPVYLYENNRKSTGGIKHTKRSSLLRVIAVERILLKIIRDRKIRAYSKYRYENIIHGRFAYLGVCYWPSLSIMAICPFIFGFKNASKHIFHYVVNYASCIKIYAHSLFKKMLKNSDK